MLPWIALVSADFEPDRSERLSLGHNDALCYFGSANNVAMSLRSGSTI